MKRKFSRVKFRNFGYTSRGCPNVPENRNNRKIRKLLFHCTGKFFGFQYLSVVHFWKFPSETEWNGPFQPGWYNRLENFRIYCSICHMKFSKFQTGILGRMESTPCFPRCFPVCAHTFCNISNVDLFSIFASKDLINS